MGGDGCGLIVVILIVVIVIVVLVIVVIVIVVGGGGMNHSFIHSMVFNPFPKSTGLVVGS